MMVMPRQEILKPNGIVPLGWLAKKEIWPGLRGPQACWDNRAECAPGRPKYAFRRPVRVTTNYLGFCNFLQSRSAGF